MSAIFKAAAFLILGNSNQDPHLNRVTSQFSSEKFKPLCLIRRKRRKIPWKRTAYTGTSFVLDNVLEGSQKTNIDVDVVGKFHSSEISKGKLSGSFKIIGEAAKADLKVSANKASSIILHLKKIKVNMQQLEDCIQTAKFNLKHSLINDLRRAGNEYLCVVTEAIITDDEVSLEQTSEVDGNLNVNILNNPEKLEGRRDSTQILKVPVGTVLAFGVCPLKINPNDGTAALCHIEYKKNKSSFQADGSTAFSSSEEDLVSPKYFNRMKEYIKEDCTELHNVSRDMAAYFLNVIMKILENSACLTAVEELLDQIMSREQPDFTLISNLWKKEDSTGNLVKNFLQEMYDLIMQEENPEETPVKPLHLLFTALNDMQDASLLVDCFKKKMITPKELEMVELILSSCSPTNEDWEFIMDAEKSMTEEQFKITSELLSKCGVKVQGEESKFKYKGDQNSQMELLKLYTVLYIFNILSS